MKVLSIAKNITFGLFDYSKNLFVNPYKKTGFSRLNVTVIKNLPRYKIQSIRFMNHSFYFFLRDEMFHSLEEIFIGEIYKQNLPPQPYIIDCGANIGLSVLYLKKQFPDSTLLAFEPDETNFSFLEKNVKSYGLQNVILKKEAVWIEDTVLSFAGHSSQMSHIDKTGGNKDAIQVKATRLKNYLDKKVDFLKIDIEGAEYEVLKDIDDSLQNVNNLFIEYHGKFTQNEELNEIFEMITRNGFRYYIQQAAEQHPTPFIPSQNALYDIQLNLYCYR